MPKLFMQSSCHAVGTGTRTRNARLPRVIENSAKTACPSSFSGEDWRMECLYFKQITARRGHTMNKKLEIFLFKVGNFTSFNFIFLLFHSFRSLVWFCQCKTQLYLIHSMRILLNIMSSLKYSTM